MKAFVEFRHEASYTKSSSHAEFKTYGACFHFIGFDRKIREKVQKTLFRGSFYKMPKVKNYFVVNIYFVCYYSKIKK